MYIYIYIYVCGTLCFSWFSCTSAIFRPAENGFADKTRWIIRISNDYPISISYAKSSWLECVCVCVCLDVCVCQNGMNGYKIKRKIKKNWRILSEEQSYLHWLKFNRPINRTVHIYIIQCCHYAETKGLYKIIIIHTKRIFSLAEWYNKLNEKEHHWWKQSISFKFHSLHIEELKICLCIKKAVCTKPSAQRVVLFHFSPSVTFFLLFSFFSFSFIASFFFFFFFSLLHKIYP